MVSVAGMIGAPSKKPPSGVNTGIVWIMVETLMNSNTEKKQ